MTNPSDLPPDYPPPMMNYEPLPRRPEERDCMGIVSLVCGAVSIVAALPSLCCCLGGILSVPLGVCGLVFGILGLQSQRRVMAQVGIGLSIGGILLCVLLTAIPFVLNIFMVGARGLHK